MIERERLYENYKRLIKYPEWKLFCEHIKEEMKKRESHCVNFLSKDKQVDAQRQAWIIEGLEEAMTLPDYIINLEETISNKIYSKVCSLCGQAIQRIKNFRGSINDFGRQDSPK